MRLIFIKMLTIFTIIASEALMKSAHAFTRWEKWATEHPPTNYLPPLDHHDHTCSHRSSTNNHNYLPRILTLCLCKFSVEMHKQDGSWISNIAWCYVVAPGNTRLGDWLTFSFYRISGCPLDTATDSGWAGPQFVDPGRQNMIQSQTFQFWRWCKLFLWWWW